MAKGIEIGIGGINKNMKRGYIGVGGVNKKIKKILVGIGGVNKVAWVDGLLAFAIREQGTSPITVINSSDGSIEKTLTLPNNYVPLGIATDNEDNLYVSYRGANSYNYVAKYSSNLDLIWEYTGTALGTGTGWHIGVNKNKEVYVVQYNGKSTGRINKLSASGEYISGYPLYSLYNRTAHPTCLALDPDGNLYIGIYELYNDYYALGKYDKDTLQCVWQAYEADSMFTEFESVAISSDGYIYTTALDMYAQRGVLSKWNATGSRVGTAVTFGATVVDIFVCCDKNKLYLYRYRAGQTTHELSTRSLADLSAITTITNLPKALDGIDVGRDGTLLGITSRLNTEIFKFDNNTLSLIATFTKSGLDRIKIAGGTIGVFQDNW